MTIPLIEISVVDQETKERITVAYFEKEICLSDSFPKDLAQELFDFLAQKKGKLLGGPKENWHEMNFFPKPLNKRPF